MIKEKLEDVEALRIASLALIAAGFFSLVLMPGGPLSTLSGSVSGPGGWEAALTISGISEVLAGGLGASIMLVAIGVAGLVADRSL